MALVEIQGFDFQNSDADYGGFIQAVGSLPYVTGRGGNGQAVQLHTSGDYLYVIYPVMRSNNNAHFRLGFAMYVSGLPDSGYSLMIECYTNSTSQEHFYFYTHADGSIQVADNDNITVGQTNSGVLQVGSWHYIELGMEVNISGAYDLHVDGIELLNGTGNFAVSSSTTLEVRMAFYNAGTSALHYLLDDMYFLHDETATAIPAALGPCKVETLVVDGDGSQSDFTGSYTDVDDPANAPNDADYIESGTVGHVSNFELEGLALSPDSIHGVQAHARMSKNGAGVRSVKFGVDSSGSISETDDISPADGIFGTYWHCVENNPNGGGAWTEAAVNSLKVTVRVTG